MRYFGLVTFPKVDESGRYSLCWKKLMHTWIKSKAQRQL